MFRCFLLHNQILHKFPTKMSHIFIISPRMILFENERKSHCSEYLIFFSKILSTFPPTKPKNWKKVIDTDWYKSELSAKFGLNSFVGSIEADRYIISICHTQCGKWVNAYSVAKVFRKMILFWNYQFVFAEMVVGCNIGGCLYWLYVCSLHRWNSNDRAHSMSNCEAWSWYTWPWWSKWRFCWNRRAIYSWVLTQLFIFAASINIWRNSGSLSRQFSNVLFHLTNILLHSFSRWKTDIIWFEARWWRNWKRNHCHKTRFQQRLILCQIIKSKLPFSVRKLYILSFSLIYSGSI